uniref:Uncharacterized protein n=1 Tax=Romanomermis culicivorax TaxID=13658 RepID=A0A915JMV5_ROMCU
MKKSVSLVPDNGDAKHQNSSKSPPKQSADQQQNTSPSVPTNRLPSTDDDEEVFVMDSRTATLAALYGPRKALSVPADKIVPMRQYFNISMDALNIIDCIHLASTIWEGMTPALKQGMKDGRLHCLLNNARINDMVLASHFWMLMSEAAHQDWSQKFPSLVKPHQASPKNSIPLAPIAPVKTMVETSIIKAPGAEMDSLKHLAITKSKKLTIQAPGEGGTITMVEHPHHKIRSVYFYGHGCKKITIHDD